MDAETTPNGSDPVDLVTEKVSELSTDVKRSETPPEKWSKRQLARHRKIINSYVLGGVPLPDNLKELDLVVNKVHPKKSPMGKSGSGPGGGEGEGSGTEGTKRAKRKHIPTGITPKTASKRVREALDSDSGQEKIADVQSTTGCRRTWSVAIQSFP